MKIIASESYTQSYFPHEVFPIQNFHNVEKITTGISVTKKEDNRVCLLFDLRYLANEELGGEVGTTVKLMDTTDNSEIPVSKSCFESKTLDPIHSYELTIIKEFSTTTISGERKITYIFSPSEQTPPAS